MHPSKIQRRIMKNVLLFAHEFDEILDANAGEWRKRGSERAIAKNSL